jgi:hypothetical protein
VHVPWTVSYGSWTGGGGKSRVWANALGAWAQLAIRQTPSFTVTYSNTTVTPSHLLVKNKGAKAETPKGQVYSQDTVTVVRNQNRDVVQCQDVDQVTSPEAGLGLSSRF